MRGCKARRSSREATSRRLSATTYGYDDVGNRRTKTVTTSLGTETTAYVYDTSDRLQTETLTTTTGSSVTTTYAWDGNGNLQSKTSPGEYSGYVFDADNRLIEVRKGSSQATATLAASYGYDADGQRVRKTTPAETTHFLIDPTTTWPQVALEKSVTVNGTQATAYVWGDTLRQQVRGGQGTLFGSQAESLVPVQGHLGTTMAALSGGASVVEGYESSAFGEPTNASPRVSHQYTGEYWDAQAGMTYLRARWYEARIGRMPSLDPAAAQGGRPSSQNRYAYAQADSVNRKDPSGAVSMGEVSISVGIGVGLNLIADGYNGRLTSPNAVALSVLWGTAEGVAFVGAAAAVTKTAATFGPAIRTALLQRELTRTFALVQHGGTQIGVNLSSQMILTTQFGKFLISSGTSTGSVTGALKHVVQDQLNRSGLGVAASLELSEALVIQELKAVLQTAAGEGIVFGQKMIVTTPAGITYEIIIDQAVGLVGRLFHLLRIP
jgi:RHS repeat-associated protein